MHCIQRYYISASIRITICNNCCTGRKTTYNCVTGRRSINNGYATARTPYASGLWSCYQNFCLSQTQSCCVAVNITCWRVNIYVCGNGGTSVSECVHNISTTRVYARNYAISVDGYTTATTAPGSARGYIARGHCSPLTNGICRDHWLRRCCITYSYRSGCC